MEIAGPDLFGDDIFQNRFRSHLLSRGFRSSLRSSHLETRINCSRQSFGDGCPMVILDCRVGTLSLLAMTK